MAFLYVLKTRQSSGLAGGHEPVGWNLQAGSAATLHVRAAGSITVTAGQFWVTADGPHRGHGNESGDVFLSVGEKLTLNVGQRIVAEPSGLHGHASGSFLWCPAVAVVPAAANSAWALEVAGPYRKLMVSTREAAAACRHLLCGLARFAWHCAALLRFNRANSGRAPV